MKKFFGVMAREGLRAALRRAAASKARRLSTLAGTDASLRRLEERLVEQQRSLDALTRRHDALALRADQLADSVRRLALLQREPAGSPPALRVSVVMPVHDRARTIGAAVESVLAQRGVQFELVLVDDGSTDGLAEALRPYLANPCLTFIQATHGGQGRARNLGLERASGDIVAYLDSDNLMMPGYLHALASAYEAAPDAQCACAALLWDDGGTDVHVRHDGFDWDSLLALRTNLDTNAFSHRRELWQALGGWDETLVRHADFDLVLRYTRAHPPIRVNALAAHYDSRLSADRVTIAKPGGPSLARIRSRYLAPPSASRACSSIATTIRNCRSQYVDAEVDWLRRRGIELVVFSEQLPGSPGNTTAKTARGDLEAAAREFRPDVIHCHWVVAGGRVHEVARSLGIPLTFRAHGFEFSPPELRQCADQHAVRTIYLFPHLAPLIPGDHGKIRPFPVTYDSTLMYPAPARDHRLVVRTAACLDTKDIELFIRVAARCPDYRFVLVLASIASLPELPGEFRALNESLGSPVEIRMDVQRAEVAQLMRSAGVYLHTFAFQRPYGMPISIAESLACGGVPIARDYPAARTYAGTGALYYDTEDEAVAHLQSMLGVDRAGVGIALAGQRRLRAQQLRRRGVTAMDA